MTQEVEAYRATKAVLRMVEVHFKGDEWEFGAVPATREPPIAS